jgi:hypothetical protein
MQPVKFPAGRHVHLGEPGAHCPKCGKYSSAEPKNTLSAVDKPVTCAWCLETRH